MGLTTFQLALSILNLTGSLLSCLSTGALILCFIFLPVRKHFRHKLILNLAVADFLNSLDNVVSGLWILSHKRLLDPGLGCIVNGFIEQVTVQGTDCAVFAITLVTVYVITHVDILLRSPSENKKLIMMVCGAVWVLPAITGFVGLGMQYYVPVSGSWCWLTPHPVYVRYVLTHGWRMAFILGEIFLYTYLYLYMRRLRRKSRPRTRQLSSFHASRITSKTASSPVIFADDNGLSSLKTSSRNSMLLETEPRFSTVGNKPIPASQFEEQVLASSPPTMDVEDTATAEGEAYTSTWSRVDQVLLLNAYPIAYIILVMPGITNRFVEASGHTSKAVQIMQASTQFVGLANALTYGLQAVRQRN